MKTSHAITHAQIGLVTLVLALGGCTASASFRAGSTTSARPAPREPAEASTPASAQASAVSESTVGARADALETEREKIAKPAKPEKAEKPQGQLALAPPPTREDHDRGHGNDADGVDEDNPGKSKKPGKAKKPEKAKKTEKGTESAPALAASATDKDRGHGNDADGVDEDNPGKSKDK